MTAEWAIEIVAAIALICVAIACAAIVEGANGEDCQ